MRRPAVLFVLMMLLVPAAAQTAIPGGEIFIPSVAEAPGDAGSHWYTTVWIHNPGSQTAHVVVSLLRRGQPNPSPDTASLEVGPGETVRVDRALSAWFNADGAVGALRLVSDRAVAAFARVFNQTSSGIEESQGQLLPGYPADLALGAGESSDVPGVAQGPDGSFRTNFGMVETSGAPASVDVTLVDGQGVTLASRRYELQPYEPIQVNLSDLAGGAAPTANGSLRFAVVAGSAGSVIPFASMVANGTLSQDPSTLEMELSCSESQGEGLDRVHHDATLSGDGTDTSPLGVADGGITTAKLSTEGATPGQVLRAATDGVVWSDETGLTLPWSGTGNNGTSLFSITQEGAGYGLQVDAPVGYGITANGFFEAGSFSNTSQGNQASLALPGYGIWATGTEEAGHFENSEGSGEAILATGDTGLVASGSSRAGVFERAGGHAVAWLCPAEGSEEFGIFAVGSNAGAVFADSDESNGARLGDVRGYGIYAAGDTAGGMFDSNTGTGSALIAFRDRGIEAFGSDAAGFFQRSGSSTDWAYLGVQDQGVSANGGRVGGYFTNSTGSGRAWTSREGWGMFATGNWMGAQFEDGDEGTKAYLAFGTDTVAGTGSKSFVQNDPADSSSVIVYSAIEGPEVGTYTRGTARLQDGRAVVPLDPTFARVTNPDVGLTAIVTPRSAAAGLHVEQVGTEELIVASDDPECDAAFDYLVMGLRIGFESVPVVRPRIQDAPIPSMAGIRRMVQEHPGLAATTPLLRHRRQAESAGLVIPEDPSRASALVQAIGQAPPEPAEAGTAPLHETHFAAPASGQLDATRETGPAAPPRDHVVVMLGSGPSLEPGVVVAWDPVSASVVPASERFRRNIVGVATEPRAEGTEPGTPVAVGGIVRCLVDARDRAIAVGDLLVTSSTPGAAAKAVNPEPGTVLGKALEPLDGGIGIIAVLVAPR